MPSYRIAHLREQGQDIIIVPLDPIFGSKSSDHQHAVIAELEAHARGAGLAGTVVVVWGDEHRMSFIAPSPWRPFFQSLSMPRVRQILNKELSW